MNNSRRTRMAGWTFVTAVLAGLALAAGGAAAAELNWKINGANPSDWNTTVDNWTPDGSSFTTYTDGGVDDARFDRFYAGNTSNIFIGSGGTPGDVTPKSVSVVPANRKWSSGTFNFSGGRIMGSGSMYIGWDAKANFTSSQSYEFSGGTTIASGWLKFSPTAAGNYHFGTGDIILSQRGTYVGMMFEPTVAGATLTNHYIVPAGGAKWYKTTNGGKMLGTMRMDGDLLLNSAGTELHPAITLTGDRTISTGSVNNNSKVTGPVDGGGTHTLTIANLGNNVAWTDYALYVEDDIAPAAWNLGGFGKAGTGNVVFRDTRDLGDNVNLVMGGVIVGNQGAVADHVGDTAAINGQGGKIMFRRDGSFDQTETVGAINLERSHTEIRLSPAAGKTYTLASAAALSRTNYATALIASPDLGGSAGGSGSGRITFPTAPTMIGGGGAAGTTNISIIPFLVGGRSTNDHEKLIMGDMGSTFVTYDAGTQSLRTLDPATEFAANIAGASADANVRKTGGETLAGSATINSLVLDGDAAGANFAIDGAGTLTVTSGAILMRGRQSGAGGVVTLDVPFLDFAGGEGVVTVTTHRTSYPYCDGIVLEINSVIQNGGLTKAGYGRLDLKGNNTFTGPFVVNSGIGGVNKNNAVYLYGTLATEDVRLIGGGTVLQADDRLGTTSTVQVGSLAELNLNGFDQTLGALDDGPAGGGTVINRAGTLSILTINPGPGNTAVFSGPVSGNNLKLVKDGPNVATFTGKLSQKYLRLAGGILRVTGRPGGSRHEFEGGILELAGSYRDWKYNDRVFFGPGGGGWSAKGNNISIWISGTTVQEWGASAAFIQDGDPLMLNTRYSDGLRLDTGPAFRRGRQHALEDRRRPAEALEQRQLVRRQHPRQRRVGWLQ